MNQREDQLIARAKALLEEKRVDVVLGFRRGSIPMARRPFCARSPEEAELLCWDEFCLANLANFLPSGEDVNRAVVAKGCDWRNLVVHHQEGRIDLSGKTYVLGIDCERMLDPEKIRRAAGGAERVVAVTCADEAVTVTVPDGQIVLERADLYRQSCLECIQRAPLSADELLQAGVVPDLPEDVEPSGPRFFRDSAGRKEALGSMFSNCIMCFACRDICPLCYCAQCFVDKEKSHWFSTEKSLDALLDFHFIRAHHIAGRCTECGACESACPMNISVRQLATALNRDIKNNSGYIPGMKLEGDAPDGVFRPSYHERSRREL